MVLLTEHESPEINKQLVRIANDISQLTSEVRIFSKLSTAVLSSACNKYK